MFRNHQILLKYKLIYTLAPVMLSFVFTIPQWWKIENDKQKKIYTLPWLLLLLWPQYRVARLLYYGFKKSSSYSKERSIYDKDINSLGKTFKVNFG